jgi:hypothetical protein
MKSKNTDLRLITLFLESFQSVFAQVFDREVASDRLRCWETEQ